VGERVERSEERSEGKEYSPKTTLFADVAKILCLEQPPFFGHSPWLFIAAQVGDKLQAKGLHSSSKPNSDPVCVGAGPRELVDFTSNIRRAVGLMQYPR